MENLQKKCSQKNDKRGLTLTVGSVKLPNGDSVIPNKYTSKNIQNNIYIVFDINNIVFLICIFK